MGRYTPGSAPAILAEENKRCVRPTDNAQTFPDSPGFRGKISSHWCCWSYFSTHQATKRRLNAVEKPAIKAW